MTEASRPGLVASMPMYRLAETADLENAWWDGLRRHLIDAGIEDVPQRMQTPASIMSHWLDAQLLLSQTCGYPLTHALRGQVALVGTPTYRVPGCTGALYTSAVLVAREAKVGSLEELRGGAAACNARDSQSGYNALRALVAPLAAEGRFFSAVHFSGSHAASIRLVAAGNANVCAVDAVTYALLGRYVPERLAGTRLLNWTAAAPGLPYVTRSQASGELLTSLRQGLTAAFADPELAEIRERLYLDEFQIMSPAAYECIIEQERTARDLGYPELA